MYRNCMLSSSLYLYILTATQWEIKQRVLLCAVCDSQSSLIPASQYCFLDNCAKDEAKTIQYVARLSLPCSYESAPHLVVLPISLQVRAQNPQLTKLPSDFLYHIGFSSEDPLKELFGDVKVRVLDWLLSSLSCVYRILSFTYRMVDFKIADSAQIVLNVEVLLNTLTHACIVL